MSARSVRWANDLTPLAAHADWSVSPSKRWIAIAHPERARWRVRVEPVGDIGGLIARLRHEAGGAPVALGLDVPLGVPRAYAARHAGSIGGFVPFLRGLRERPGFFAVCDDLPELGPDRPFYPQRGRAGMTRAAHAQALGLPDAAALSRACDRATPDRPAGAPVFWTLGANQSGKAALSAWRDLLLPALAAPQTLAIWPFDGCLLELLTPGRCVVAETYPAEALRQLGLRLHGSKRRQADRLTLAPALRAAMAALGAAPDPALDHSLGSGFGADAAGEDRFDCVLGVLCVLQVLLRRRTDAAPDDPWVQAWEGWVLGQAATPNLP